MGSSLVPLAVLPVLATAVVVHQTLWWTKCCSQPKPYLR
jgi:hypothetical protein